MITSFIIIAIGVSVAFSIVGLGCRFMAKAETPTADNAFYGVGAFFVAGLVLGFTIATAIFS